VILEAQLQWHESATAYPVSSKWTNELCLYTCSRYRQKLFQLETPKNVHADVSWGLGGNAFNTGLNISTLQVEGWNKGIPTYKTTVHVTRIYCGMRNMNLNYLEVI
jgi:hypothetical protein